MIIEDGYLGYLKYDGNAVNDGHLDARMAAEALIGLDEAFRHFIREEKPAWLMQNMNLPVRIERGCWQIMIPTGLAVFAGYYLKSMAEVAGKEGLFETGFAKDLNKVLMTAFDTMKGIIALSKHLGAVGSREAIKRAKFKDDEHVSVTGRAGNDQVYPVRFVELYAKCPADLFSKCVSIVDDERDLEIGSIVNGKVVNAVRIFAADRDIFYKQQSDEDQIVLPELEHGKEVDLDGEITRINESDNTLGFAHGGHVLNCRPRAKIKIASFKGRIISQQDGHVFPKVRIYGVVDRLAVDGSFKAKKPAIIVTDIQRLEDVQDTLF